jgi:hypothetical protein
MTPLTNPTRFRIFVVILCALGLASCAQKQKLANCSDKTIVISPGANKATVSDPAIHVRPGCPVKWESHGDLPFVTIFLNSSPFDHSNNVHHNGHKGDNVNACPSGPDDTCPFPYTGLLIVNGTAQVIDPQIIVDPHS